MKTKAFAIIFALIAVLLLCFFLFSRNFLFLNDKSITHAKIVTPKTVQEQSEDVEQVSASGEMEKYETFVPLMSGETLISTLTVDINNDGYDDEVILVRKNTSQYLWIVPGIYSLENQEYDRFTEIQTKFTRTRTFSYNAMDLIGEHKNSLICQGLDDEGNYVMQIYNYKESQKNGPEFVCIGDFSSDGTVFVQQTERSENYELGISKGDPYSVWVYKTEEKAAEQKNDGSTDTAASGANQIQQEYKWNAAHESYELNREIKVTASRLMAKELSKIQDGTVESFASFLNGLWYKTSNTDGNIRYLYFDYDKKEIIHLYADSQEVYEWDESKVRHNGIYLTTVNEDIVTLHRRFDISLVNTDEIRVTIRDDINLVIKESTMWDGQYKKLSLQNTFNEASEDKETDTFLKEIQKGDEWTAADGETKITFGKATYTISNGTIQASGVYAVSKIGQNVVLQLRADQDSGILSDAYSASFGTKIVTETVRKKTVEKAVTDYNNLILIPVKITPTDCFATEGHTYNFSRTK